MTYVRWIVSVTAVCCALAFSACQGQGGTGASEYSEPNLTEVPVIDSSLRLPFDRYSLPDSASEQMVSGTIQLFERCLEARGIVIPDDAFFGGDFVRGLDAKGDQSLVWGGHFGTLDEAHARRYGYRAAPEGPYANGPGFYLKSADNVSLGGWTSAGQERATRELEGPLEGGRTPCRDDVEEQIGTLLVDLSDRRRDTHKLAMGHPRVAPTLAAWKECMSEVGHPGLENVWDAQESVHMRPLSEKEIILATHDVECTRSSRWSDFYYAAVADYQEQAIANNPDLFSAALDAARQRADAIEALLGQGTSKATG